MLGPNGWLHSHNYSCSQIRGCDIIQVTCLSSKARSQFRLSSFALDAGGASEKAPDSFIFLSARVYLEAATSITAQWLAWNLPASCLPFQHFVTDAAIL